MIKSDTIAAISTAMSSSGIGIVRISGNEACEIIDKVYRSKKNNKKISEQKSHTIHYGYIVDGEDLIDEVLVSILRGPASFTAEDTIEINCHGGVLAMKKVLETVIKNGARTADPGEFTKRAFLNGRIDLSQAEAVIDIINAKNEYALKSSVSQLKGSVQNEMHSLREKILYHIAYIESALDDPEHISLEGYACKLEKLNCEWMERLIKLINSSENGRILKEGIRTVIVGKPNAGKSSLLNILVGEDKAIVTDVAGTTRDVLEESVRIHGISLNIMDTAGIRETEDIVEKIGVSRARDCARDADLILYVVDSSTPLDQNDEDIISLINGKKAIVLLNKTDLTMVTNEKNLKEKISNTVISISVKKNEGIDRLEETLKNMFFDGELSFNDQIYITNMRHKAALEDALESMIQLKESIQNGMPEDFYSIDLRNSYESLGEITGESIGEDLVNEIFGKFCMGK